MVPEFAGVTVTRHDLSLLAIAAALIAGTVVGLVSSVRLSWSLLVASVPAICFLAYAVFYRPPE